MYACENEMLPEKSPGKAALIFAKQFWHLVWLVLLVSCVIWLGRVVRGFWQGEFLGVSTRVWLWLCLGDAVAHQVYVWFCWRTELYGRLLTRVLGKNAFRNYGIIFVILIIGRVVLVTALAISNYGTVKASLQPMMHMLAGVFALPVAYLFWSVKRYFTFTRALGADHFDVYYRSAGLVRGGIFKYSSNAMYTFGMLALWIPGLLCGSTTAIIAAAFSHAYVWVHYFCTEKPDMEFIYCDK